MFPLVNQRQITQCFNMINPPVFQFNQGKDTPYITFNYWLMNKLSMLTSPIFKNFNYRHTELSV